MLETFDEMFFVLDALDECSQREDLLQLIESIHGWRLSTLHILATSRREKDIEEALNPLVTVQIGVQDALISADIRTYLEDRLQNDSKLKLWREDMEAEIKESLMRGAHGM